MPRNAERMWLCVNDSCSLAKGAMLRSSSARETRQKPRNLLSVEDFSGG